MSSLCHCYATRLMGIKGIGIWATHRVAPTSKAIFLLRYFDFPFVFFGWIIRLKYNPVYLTAPYGFKFLVGYSNFFYFGSKFAGIITQLY